MSEEKVITTYDQPILVEVTKGISGPYGWKMSVKGDSSKSILDTIQELDEALKKRYGEREREKK